MRATTLAVSFAFGSRALAWGPLGHATVAFIAEHFVDHSTARWAKHILNETGADYLANVASWADDFRHTDEGDFSGQLHYIDAEDDPPNSCNVKFERDCPEDGCIVSALANYTERVQDFDLDAIQRQQALKFIIHFSGDIAEPLHAEAIAIGGNTIGVLWNGTETNLHSVWDDDIPAKIVGGDTFEDARDWASELSAEIKHGKYRWDRKSWLCGLDVSDPIDTALDWARDSNAFVCSTVIPNGPDAVDGEELSGEYYESTVDVVELSIARAGYRLAAYLDMLAAGEQEGWFHPHFPKVKGWGKKHHDVCH